jgi:hypothetical protein
MGGEEVGGEEGSTLEDMSGHCEPWEGWTGTDGWSETMSIHSQPCSNDSTGWLICANKHVNSQSVIHSTKSWTPVKGVSSSTTTSPHPQPPSCSSSQAEQLVVPAIQHAAHAAPTPRQIALSNSQSSELDHRVSTQHPASSLPYHLVTREHRPFRFTCTIDCLHRMDWYGMEWPRIIQKSR